MRPKRTAATVAVVAPHRRVDFGCCWAGRRALVFRLDRDIEPRERPCEMTRPRMFHVCAGATMAWSLVAPQVVGCASSQIEQGAEHPASPEAQVAPIQPVGEALSNEDEAAADDVSPGPEHSHGEHASGTEPNAAGSSSAGATSEHTEHAQGATPPPATPSGHDHHVQAADEKPAEVWTCPMHPEVREPKPGKCPKCGMTLVPAEPKKAP